MSDFPLTDDLEWAAMAKEVRSPSLSEARIIFKECYALATGRKAWDE